MSLTAPGKTYIQNGSYQAMAVATKTGEAAAGQTYIRNGSYQAMAVATKTGEAAAGVADPKGSARELSKASRNESDGDSEYEYDECEEEQETPRKARIEMNDTDGHLTHFEMDASDAIECMGISAFCLFNTTGWVNLSKLYMISIQGFFLQYTILYFMYTQLVPYDEDVEGPRNCDKLIVTVAVYLHLVNGISGIPFGMMTLFQFSDLKESWSDVAATLPIFFIDACVTPVCTAVIGSLYLCSSNTVADVILNSCAVAFIDNIDNWILTLNDTMNKLGGNARDETMYLPYQRKALTTLSWVVCVVPVIPLGLAIGFTHLGLDVMKL